MLSLYNSVCACVCLHWKQLQLECTKQHSAIFICLLDYSGCVDVLPINQSRLSSERPDGHKITCKSIYTCQRFDLQLKLYTKYIMKPSEL